MNEVFGEDNFVNEIVWKRSDAHADASAYGRIHDTIYLYSHGQKRIWNQQHIPYTEEYIKNQYRYVDDSGKRFLSRSLSASGLSGGGYAYVWNGLTRSWRCPKSTMERYEAENRLTYTGKGLVRYKQYLDEMPGLPVQSIWDTFPKIHHLAHERVEYPTQKPEALLERIIKASSNPGDLVLDCFCGSGTTAAVAEKLGRRWITCDLGRFAIHTARKRLLGIENVKPFTVQNLGKYERQAWQTAEFGENAEALTRAYREFILSLYRAKPLNGYVWLHGVRSGRLVHVGGVDAPVSQQDVAQIAAEFKRMTGTGKDAPTLSSVDVLGWDFAFEINEVAKQQAALAGVEMRFFRIPREILEKKAVEQGDIKFFELAALSVKHEVKGRSVLLEMTDFIIPLDDVPEDVQRAITHWEQWIDYWAVDWDNKGDTFHNQWQSYRTRKDKTLQKQIAAPPGTYTEPGEYKVVVKVIDILGNDTTKTVKVIIS
jgi:adenine-specific DNA-methyltransferase